MSEQPDSSAVDGDIVTEDELKPSVALELRRSSAITIPATVDQMAALGDRGVEVIQARHQIMDTLRKSSILLTYPDDWLLFRTREGDVFAYLQDSGCDRVAPLWGIEIFGVSEKPERIVAEDKSFAYVVRGSGRCSLTGQTVENMEGMRTSTDDIAKNLTGIQQEYTVRKSARANLDGGILRELAGLKRVPLQALIDADPTRQWEQRAAKGRGYGSGGQRQQEREGEIDLTSPVPSCQKCNGPMWDNRRDKKNPRAPDFKCKKQGGDPNCDGAKWLEKKTGGAPPPQTQTSRPAQNEPPPERTDEGTTAAPPQRAAAPPAANPTAAPSGGAPPPQHSAEEETRLRRTIKAQIKGKKWNAQQTQDLIDEYLEACGLEKGGTLDNLRQDSLQEMHEELMKN